MEMLFREIESRLAEQLGTSVDVTSMVALNNGKWSATYQYDGPGGKLRKDVADFRVRLNMRENSVIAEDFQLL